MTKQNILNNLEAFAMQRPGLSLADYGDRNLYRRDYREHCEKPLRAFRAMLAAIEWRDSLTAFDLRQAIRETSRLKMLDDGTIDYTPGQMGATEFRHAACNAMAGALWDYWATDTPIGMTPREYVMQQANIEFGQRIVRNYFG